MRAILIDTANREIKEVDVDESNSLRSMYSLMGCDLVDVAFNFNNDNELWDSLYVDDEGLMKTDNPLFYISMESDPMNDVRQKEFAGSGLILGVDMSTGESVPARVSIDEVKRSVIWLDAVL